MPGSGAALLIALAMVPGYLYLQLTRQVRVPFTKSALGEVLEIVGVGLGTTGLAVAIGLMLWPGSAVAVLRRLQMSPHDLSAYDVRYVAIIAAVILGMALVFAGAAGWGARTLMRGRYSPSVLKATLGLQRVGHVSVVAMRLADGRVVDGVLHAYTLGDAEESRSVALKAPIRQLVDGKPVVVPGADYFVAFGPDIKHLTMKLHPAGKGGSLPDPAPRPFWARRRSSP